MAARVRVGVSACLLGDEVRYDGGHKRDAWLADELGSMVDFVKVCPEVEAGMSTPREPITLVRRNGVARAIGVTSGADETDRLLAFAQQRIAALAGERLSGYVFKKNSPSCDTETGLFATALRERLPDLPVDDEARLADPDVRQRFVERVFAYHHRAQRS